MLAFVLSGGGNRGALQVGALQVLLEAGIRPDMVVGTSVGAVNACFLANDPTPRGAYRLAEVWLDVTRDDVYPGTHLTAVWNMVRGKESFFSNESWRRLLQSHMPVHRFGDLAVPAYAVAADLETGQQFVFGDDEDDLLLDGIMASTALPPLHPPWHVGGRRYIDGGAVADLPVRVAGERGASEIIALNLANSLTPGDQVRTLFGIMNRAIGTLVYRHTEADLEYMRRNSDIGLRTIELHYEMSMRPWDFSHSAELIALGRSTMKAALEKEPLVQQTWRDRVAEQVSKAVSPVLTAMDEIISRRQPQPQAVQQERET